MTRSTTRTRRRVVGRIGSGLAATGAAAAILTFGGTAANASYYGSTPLSPGQGTCSPSQYASFQVRADGWATNQGAKFKLLRNGQVVTNTPSRANSWAVELRSSWGNFPGPGYYSVCAQNTGTANTTVTLQLRTDYEF
jgi:hypothetical protein